MDNRYLFGKQLSIIGCTMELISDFETVMSRLYEDHFKAVIAAAYPLKSRPAALNRLAVGDKP